MRARNIALSFIATLFLAQPVMAGVTAGARVDTSGVNMQPAYPGTALAGREQGTVIVGVKVRENGTVKDIAVVKSSGYDDLDSAAANAVYHWRFVPALQDGNSIDGTANVQIVFNPPAQ